MTTLRRRLQKWFAGCKKSRVDNSRNAINDSQLSRSNLVQNGGINLRIEISRLTPRKRHTQNPKRELVPGSEKKVRRPEHCVDRRAIWKGPSVRPINGKPKESLICIYPEPCERSSWSPSVLCRKGQSRRTWRWDVVGFISYWWSL